MAFIQTYGKEIIALLAPIIIWSLNRLFRARAKLVLSSPHLFNFIVQEPQVDEDNAIVSQGNLLISTRSYLVRNEGKETATKVELVFNWKPLCINIWPSRHYREHVEQDNRYVMIFDSLAPSEFLGFELLSVQKDLPVLITARSDQCTAIEIEMYPQPVVKDWQKRLAILLMLGGMAFFVYISIIVTQFLILKTPYGL